MSGGGFMWVACDPKQPGTAFAACIDDGSPEMFRDLHDWSRRGATPKRVTAEEGSEMLRKWVRPSRKKKATNNAASTKANRK